MMKTGRLFFANLLFGLTPPTRCFGLKRVLLRWCGAEIGANVRIASSARFHLTGKLVIGDHTWVGHEVLVVGGDAEVTIGAKVDIAPRVMIVTGSHKLVGTPGRAAGKGYSLPVAIEDGAWLGAAAVILGGVTVGRCSVVAAGALVNRNVAPETMVAGVPARPVPQITSHGAE
jgi:acetyltransferase-like isoleucine patch superfamily enzyme